MSRLIAFIVFIICFILLGFLFHKSAYGYDMNDYYYPCKKYRTMCDKGDQDACRQWFHHCQSKDFETFDVPFGGVTEDRIVVVEAECPGCEPCEHETPKVPIPGAVLLLGSGLTGLIVWRKMG